MQQLNYQAAYLGGPRRAHRTASSRPRTRFRNLVVAAGMVAAGSLPAGLMTMLPARALAFDSAAAEAQLTGAINADRAGNGQGPLMVNATLASIARSAPHSVCGGQSFHGRSQDMIERVYFSHQIPPCGSYVWPVMSAYGVQFSASGENIGWNNYDPTTSVAQVNTAFMNSPGHRANILGAYNQVGVGAFMAPGTWNGTSGVIMYTEIFSMGPAPAPVYPPFTGRAQVGVVGTDGHLWATQGGGFSSLGGNLLAAPAVATVPAVRGGVLYVGTGTDHDLWVRSPGMGWQRLNGGAAVYCIDNPAVAVIGSTLHVACQGRDRALWYASGTISGGSLPSVGGWRSLGGVLASGPAAGQLPGAATPVFLVEGTDHAIWTRDVAGSGWGTTGWVCFGHPAFAGTPIGTAYFACHGADGQVWAAANDGSGWSGAWAIGGSVVDGVAVSLTPTGANFLYQGLDGHVYEISRTNGSQSGISVLGGSVKYGVGAAP